MGASSSTPLLQANQQNQQPNQQQQPNPSNNKRQVTSNKLNGPKTLRLAKTTLPILANAVGTLPSLNIQTSAPFTLKNPVARTTMAQFEGLLTICAYMSRLAYLNDPMRQLVAYSFLHYSPIVFNTALSRIATMVKSTLEKYANRLTSRPENETPRGYALYDRKEDTPVNITCLPKTIISNEPTVFVAFRGTASFKTALKDANVVYKSLFDLYKYNGKQLFVEEEKIPTTATSNWFAAHRGFVTGIEGLFSKIVDAVLELTKTYNAKSIHVTGHSLGGAFATLFAMGLAQYRATVDNSLPVIQCVTFGAPKLFSDRARNVFNELLLNGNLQFARVVNRPRRSDMTGLTYDLVPLVPGTADHAGFMPLKMEFKTQSRTGRTKQIREMREMFAGISQQTYTGMMGMLSKAVAYNPLPTYHEYLQLFRDIQARSLTEEYYKGLLSTTVMGTVYLPTVISSAVSTPAKSVIKLLDTHLSVTEDDIASYTQARKKLEEDALEESKQGEIVNPKAALSSSGEDVEPTGATGEGNSNATGSMSGGGVSKPSNTTTSYTAKYKAKTVEMMPNMVVYTCNKLLGGVLFACHASYMGVSFTGALQGFGSGTGITSARDYSGRATLYYHLITDTWSYLSDRIKGTNKRNNTTRKNNKRNGVMPAPSAPPMRVNNLTKPPQAKNTRNNRNNQQPIDGDPVNNGNNENPKPPSQ